MRNCWFLQVESYHDTKLKSEALLDLNVKEQYKIQKSSSGGKVEESKQFKTDLSRAKKKADEQTDKALENNDTDKQLDKKNMTKKDEEVSKLKSDRLSKPEGRENDDVPRTERAKNDKIKQTKV